VINMDGMFVLDVLLCGHTSREVRVSCSHLRVLGAGRFITGCIHACWIMSGEVCRGWATNGKVCRVGPQAGMFVEAYNILKAMVEYVHDIIGCANLI